MKIDNSRRSRNSSHLGWLPWAALALGWILFTSLLLIVDSSGVCAQTTNPGDMCTLPPPVEEGTDWRYVTRTPGTLPTMTAQPTNMPEPTATPQPTDIPAPTMTAQPTSPPAPTATPQPTDIPAPTATSQPTEAPPATSTPEPLVTATAAQPTITPVPIGTEAPTSTATTQPAATNTAQPTPMPIPTPTATPLVRVVLPPARATATAIAEPTATQPAAPTTLPVASPTATSTPGATARATNMPSAPTPTPMPTSTSTSTSEPPPTQPKVPTNQPQIVSSDGETSQVGVLPAKPSATIVVPTPRITATPKPRNSVRPTTAPKAATATPESGNAQPSSAEGLPQNPGDNVQTSASMVDASQPLARTSPGGLVYTTAMRRDSAGGYVVVACVANVGEQDVTMVDVAFALVQPKAAITSLRAPAAPGEISTNQARAIIGSIPPQFQTQLEIAVRSTQPLAAGEVQVNVPKAYRLTDADPALRCDPQGGMGTLPELVRAEFTIGGQSVTVQDVAQALFGSVASTNAAYLSSLSGTPIAANGLFIALAMSALFIIGLAVVAFTLWRR